MAVSKDQKELWDLLHHRTRMLFAVWKLYTALFGNKATVDNMNAVSGLGFRLIQDCMVHEQIRLAMAITDRAGEGKRANLSVKRLIQFLPGEAATQINSKLDAMMTTLETLRTHRNKRLMHFDLSTVRGKAALPKMLTDDLDAAVRGIGDVMSDISLALFNAHNIYDWIQLDNANGKLEWMIRDTLRLRDLSELARRQDVNDEQLRDMLLDRAGRRDYRFRMVDDVGE